MQWFTVIGNEGTVTVVEMVVVPATTVESLGILPGPFHQCLGLVTAGKGLSLRDRCVFSHLSIIIILICAFLVLPSPWLF